MRILVALAALVMTLVSTQLHAHACELPMSPFEKREVAAAAADVIAAVVVDRVDDSKALATAHVTAALQGNVKVGDQLVIREMVGVDHGKDACAMTRTAVGQAHIVMLYNPEAAASSYTQVYAPTMIADTPDERAATMAAIAKHHPVSPWVTTSGIASRLVLDPMSKPDEVNFYVVVRNVTTRRIELKRKWWPLAEATPCALAITGSAPAVATKVPIDDKDIAAYFTAHDGAFTFYVAPGFTELIYLPRVTTAAKGYGYKEQLGFRYYPIATHGDYKVTASCPRWLPSTTITTGAVTVRL